jgi:hypothetical protein
VTRESWAPVATAVIAGAVALIGYLLTQHAARRERKGTIYAEALAAVRSLEEMPFRIRRRLSSEPETRAALATRLSDVFTDLRFHITYLQVDSKIVGDCFIDLVDRTRKFGTKFRMDAWASPVMTTDADMNMRFSYNYDNRRELALCVVAMRRELSIWGFALRWRTRWARWTLRQTRREQDRAAPSAELPQL